MLIANALAALPGEKDFRRTDILVREGKIARIAAAGSLADVSPADALSAGEETIDASGLMMFPGAIDPHVHFDEPGFTQREDFLHGSSEAARGGVTTVIDMPCTSLPPVTSLAALKNKLAIVSKSAVVDFAFYGGVNGLFDDASMDLAIDALAPRVVGFKCYFVSGMDSFTAVTPEQFARAYERCAAAGRPLLLHAEYPAVIAAAQAALSAARGGKAPTWKDYYASRPMEAETAACSTALRLAGARPRWLHIVHVGTAEAAALVAAAGASCETCAHYLAFDEDDFETLGAALKTAPPVKEASQKALLWKRLAEGAISFVASDHAGAPDYEKFTGDPLSAYGGIPGTGTFFPYLLSEGFFAKRLSLPRFLEATSGAAAARYGISGGKGSLAEGKDADFVLVDPEASTLLDPASMYSKSRITPFAGMRLAGRIKGTFVRGSRVYGAGGILALPGSGKFIQWGYR
ncbi:MAG TPA: amidohydrolase family protein [Rectinemataceae bacterium]|nr:amidohydrolase family protein [Rectinemataceae bacterium]